MWIHQTQLVRPLILRINKTCVADIKIAGDVHASVGNQSIEAWVMEEPAWEGSHLLASLSGMIILIKVENDLS